MRWSALSSLFAKLQKKTYFNTGTIAYLDFLK